MEFIITTASSDYLSTEYEKPCKEAFSKEKITKKRGNINKVKQYEDLTKWEKKKKEMGWTDIQMSEYVDTLSEEEVEYSEEWRVNIDSIEELINLSKEVNNDIIVHKPINDNIPLLIIYDDWIE